MNLVVLATQRGPIVRVFERNLETRGRELVLNLSARAAHRLDGRARDGVRDLVEMFLEFEDVEDVSILLPDGRVLASSPESTGTSPAVARPDPGAVVVVAGDEAAEFRAAVPGTDAVACLRLSNRALAATVKRIGLTIAAIAAVAVGSGFVLVFAGASAITRPIRRLADLARRIRGGEVGARIDLRRADEIGELGAAMNAMSVDLAEKDRNLRSAKEAVEEQNRTLLSQGRRLAAQTRNLETLVASISEGVLFLGLDRRVAIANGAAERILGVPGDRLRGSSLPELRFPGSGSRVVKMLEEACGCADRHARFHSQAYVGDHLYTVTTVHESGEDALGVLAVAQDLSKIRALEMEQKDLLDQLYQQDKMSIVGLLAASLAHELNTPLATILLQTQRVAREIVGSEEARALEVAGHEVRRCREIVRRLLDFSRLAEGNPVELDLGGPVERCIALVEPGLRKKGISIRESVAADLPLVRADANQVEQVLMNLIANSADAMPAGGRIDIDLRPAQRGVELRVRDEGKGIPPQDRERVFEPFFTTKPKGKGTGLGLAICRRIMEEHEGTIEVQPLPRGGTQVRLYLPAVELDRA